MAFPNLVVQSLFFWWQYLGQTLGFFKSGFVHGSARTNFNSHLFDTRTVETLVDIKECHAKLLLGWLTHKAKHPEVKEHVGLHECIYFFLQAWYCKWNYVNSAVIAVLTYLDIMFTIWMFQFQIRPPKLTGYWRFATVEHRESLQTKTFCLATTKKKNQPLVLAPPN